jgi:membrane protease YdiL (CAAX protease family)
MVEELYFRGYLLPRMKGKYAILFHSFLFAAIHVFTPWMIIARTIGFLPIIIGTTKKNIYLGMIEHMLCNSVGFFTGLIFILKM